MLCSPKRLFRLVFAGRRNLWCLACVGAALLSCGCALRHGDLALDGKLRIELSPQTGPLFYGVEVIQRVDELVVSGFGRRPTPRGHIEILVIDADGASLAHVRTDPLPPRAVPNRSYNYRFQASLPVAAPSGSTLRITYARPTDESGREP